MGEGHRTGGEDHQHGEDLLHAGEVEGLVRLHVQLDTAEQCHAEQCYQQADAEGDDHALLAAQVQTDMLETFGHRHQGDHETGEKHVQRDEAFGVLEGMIGVDDQFLHAHEQAEGDDPRKHWRDHPAGDDRPDGLPVHRVGGYADGSEADDGADNRMRRGNRPALHRRDHQPGTGRQQRRHHAQHHQIGRDDLGIDDAVLDRLGNLATGQVGAAELEDHRHDDRLLDGQRTGTHRSAHGVGDIVGTDTPGHEETECAGENQEYEAVIRNKRHKENYLLNPERTLAPQRASNCSRRLPTRSARSATSPIHSMIL